MPFSEEIKLEVKQKALFRCCRCQTIGIDVHHIIPENVGGPSTIENAAPLCQNCHDQFGANPEKRKQLIQMRDYWYKLVEQQYSSDNKLNIQLMDSINTRLENIQKGQQEITELKPLLLEVAQTFINSITSGSASNVASDIVNLATGTQISQNVYADFRCTRCGSQIGLMIGSNKCPNCGEEIVPNNFLRP
jgi:predicted RNA-binding Zn-ribbon protein involved in translation (DUF1610 family)